MRQALNETINIFLFDVDGVLIDPLAYKAGIKLTIEMLCSQIGLPEAKLFVPDDAEIAYLESRGVHDTWDMTNIMFALILASTHRYLQTLGRTLQSAKQETKDRLLEIASASPIIDRPNYNAFTDKLATASESAHPPDIAYNLLAADLESFGPTEDRECWMKLFRDFLHGTRSAYESYGTRIYQNIILGSDEFRNTYKLESQYSGSSLLKTLDKVLISADSVRCLVKLKDNCENRIAIYTARPSLPPLDVALPKGYSPEAEMATETAGLASFPLVGMGMMEWLATEHHERTEDLTKPNTTHSLAAILAAVAQQNTSDILQLAYQFERADQTGERLELAELKDKNIHVYVFEDTISGIKPMIRITEKLKAQGYLIAVTPLGIARDENKKQALSLHCQQQVFSDVNQALSFCISRCPRQ